LLLLECGNTRLRDTGQAWSEANLLLLGLRSKSTEACACKVGLTWLLLLLLMRLLHLSKWVRVLSICRYEGLLRASILYGEVVLWSDKARCLRRSLILWLCHWCLLDGIKKVN